MNNTPLVQPEITIDGVLYKVIRETPFEFEGKTRLSMVLQRPKGKRFYMVVRYENRTFSKPVSCRG